MKPRNTLLYTLISILFINLLLTGCGVDSSGGTGAQQGGQNSATLSWEAPTTNADGTALTDLAGYKVYYGKASGAYTEIKDVGPTDTPGTPEYTVADLESGSHYYFAITAYDTSGNESNFSEEVYKDIP